MFTIILRIRDQRELCQVVHHISWIISEMFMIKEGFQEWKDYRSLWPKGRLRTVNSLLIRELS